MGLLKQFEGMQLPAASELEWLVPEHDAPQKVGPSLPPARSLGPSDLALLPHTPQSGVSLSPPLTQEHALFTRMLSA